jgi:integrase
MALTDTAVRNAKAKEKPYKLGDSGGLFVIVRPNGAKWWRLKYRFGGKEKQLSLGVYPDVSLSKARERRDEYRKLLADDIDPSGHRKAQRTTSVTFEKVARQWFAKQQPSWSTKYTNDVSTRLERYVYPVIGQLPIADIKTLDFVSMLDRVQARKTYETAARIHRYCAQICDYARVVCEITHNPAEPAKAGLIKVKPKHFAAITKADEVGPFLRMIDAYRGTPVVMAALRLAPLFFVRPGELRHAEWSQFTLDAKNPQWEFVASKTGTPHVVPLAPEAVSILRELHQETGTGRWVFPSARTSERPMSENAILVALRSMGIPQDRMTGHGVRATARTLLREELGYPPDAIEAQLAHVTSAPQGAAYDRAQHLDVRRRMMADWASYLNRLRSD